MTALKSIGKKSESSTKEQMFPSCWEKKKRKQKHPGPWKLSLWLTWVWKLQSHHFPKCGKFRSCREQCELCERAPARVRAFTPGYWWVLRSDGLKSIEKSIIRAPLNIRDCWSHIYPSPVFFFFHMRALFLATCYKTQALLQLWPDHHEQRALTFRISRRRSSHHSSHPAGDEVCGMSAAVPCNPGWWPGQNLWITRQPCGWPRNYVNILSGISIGQWLCFSHMASFRSYGLGMWVYTTHKPCWAKILPWLEHDKLSIH